MAKRRQSVSLQEEDAFKLVIDELMEEIVWHPSHDEVDVADWLLKMVDYNVPQGKQLRGRGVISAFKSFFGETGKEDLKPIYVLGWCVELFAASFYIPEDVMKSSVMRRGRICWHLLEEVGKSSVNDAFLLQSAMYFILNTRFKGHRCEKEIMRIFHKCYFNTCLGQNMDARMAKAEGFCMFNMENYKRVSKYKVGYFSFYLPMALGKIMADEEIPEEEELEMIEDIALEMGHLFLIQDDYLDCFGNPEITGRFGSKIQGNSVSWFLLKALEKMNREQEKELKENYGKVGTERVHRVLKVFRDLNLIDEYRRYEMKCYKAIMKKITQLPDSIPALYFSETLDLILKRDR